MTTSARIETLRQIMDRLRHPETGCPWDLEQTFKTIAPHTIEEAYEVSDAIDHGTPENLKDELGDLLFQVIFHARMAEEQNLFTLNDIIDTLNDKLVRRHPHVFGADPTPRPDSAKGVSAVWDQIKAEERAAKDPDGTSVLSGVTRALPALSRSVALGRRAASVGFDWPTVARVLEKVEEERRELDVELQTGADPEKTGGELGDLLFVLAQLARKLGIDPESALRGTNAKFERRFQYVETRLGDAGRSPRDATLEEMEDLWQDAKKTERKSQRPGGDVGFA